MRNFQNGTRITDEPISIERKNKVYYYHYDGLGSVTSLTDKNQKIVESYSYDSFGNFKRQGNKVKNSFTYTGREFDKETGLYYYRNRYYDPTIGRFITQDPMGMVDGPNPYTYVGNNPVNFIDPWGWSKEKGIPWWQWWLYEMPLPGWYYGQPVSEWGPYGPTGGFSPMQYSEAAGGGWMWAERAALGISTTAAVTAGTLIGLEAAGISNIGAADVG